jgi:MSHA biogenesis protein MshK
MDIAVSAVRTLLLLAFAGGVAGSAAAQAPAMSDPTRPPAVLGVQGGQGGDAGAPGEPAAPQLQSILASREPGGRRVAVINGELVKRGTKVGDAVVERVGETEVVLRRGKKLETLKLFPKP